MKKCCILSSFDPPGIDCSRALQALRDITEAESVEIVPVPDFLLEQAAGKHLKFSQRLELCQSEFSKETSVSINKHLAECFSDIKSIYGLIDELYRIDLNFQLVVPAEIVSRALDDTDCADILTRMGPFFVYDANSALLNRIIYKHVPAKPIEFSDFSKHIRRMYMLGFGNSLMKHGTIELIQQFGLFQFTPETNLKNPEDLCEAVNVFYDFKRLAHVQGCVELAVHYAEIHGLDDKMIDRAARMHDITKSLPTQYQLIILKNYGILPTYDDLNSPLTLHALTGALVAEHVFGETAPICNAIRWHTTGHANMSESEAVLYLADMLEKTRSFPGVDKLRSDTELSLMNGLRNALSHTIEYLQNNGQFIHQESRNAFNWAMQESNFRSEDKLWNH